VNKTRWAVAVQSKNIPLDLEISTAFCQCLQQLGHQAVLVQDGESAGFEADVLLLFTYLGNFPAYCRRLKNCGSQRPRTILWHIDPLPPENLPREAEAVGLKATRWKDRFRLHQSASALPRWKKICTLFRLRAWANKQCSAPGYRKATRLIQRRIGEEFNWVQVRGAMETWRRILDAQQEGWLDQIAVSTNPRRRFLASRGITAPCIPVGAHEEMGCDLGSPRDIPVGFLGNVKPSRRAQKLERLSKRLKENGIALARMTEGCYGKKRCEWLNRIRILVHLHNCSWDPAWIRFLMAARCGTLVVSEPMYDEHPMIAGVHYVEAALDEMPEVIGKLLDDPAITRQVTSAAADLCQHELTLLRATEKLIDIGETVNAGKQTRL
jgi:hypothetical protein